MHRNIISNSDELANSMDATGGCDVVCLQEMMTVTEQGKRLTTARGHRIGVGRRRRGAYSTAAMVEHHLMEYIDYGATAHDQRVSCIVLRLAHRLRWQQQGRGPEHQRSERFG